MDCGEEAPVLVGRPSRVPARVGRRRSYELSRQDVSEVREEQDALDDRA
jgi:hypothetical protein